MYDLWNIYQNDGVREEEQGEEKEEKKVDDNEVSKPGYT